MSDSEKDKALAYATTMLVQANKMLQVLQQLTEAQVGLVNRLVEVGRVQVAVVEQRNEKITQLLARIEELENEKAS